MPTTGVAEALERRLVARRLYPVVAVLIVVAAAVATALGTDYAPRSWTVRIDGLCVALVSVLILDLMIDAVADWRTAPVAQSDGR